MKIVAKERIKAGGQYTPANKACEVPDDVGKSLVDNGKAEKVAGRPSSGGQSSAPKAPTAAELAAQIAGLEDVERLRQLAEDKRKTVSDAACARLKELEGDGDGDGDGGGQDGDGDGTGDGG